MYVKILLSNCKFLICTFFLVVIQNVNHILTTEQKKMILNYQKINLWMVENIQW